MSWLPADTSLQEVRQAGALRVCVPPLYPPLITGDPAAPGLEVELLRAVAGELGVGLALNVNSAMGRDFNPRSWRLTRSQCQVVAGGVVDSPITRAFLDITPPHGETGWAVILTGAEAAAEGAEEAAPLAQRLGPEVGVLVSSSGLDRLALSRFLSAQGIVPLPLADEAALQQGLVSDRFRAAITEGLLAEALARPHPDWQVAWLPPPLPRYPLVFGLWKGDLTLKRAIVAALERIEADGRGAALRARYGVTGLPTLGAD